MAAMKMVVLLAILACCEHGVSGFNDPLNKAERVEDGSMEMENEFDKGVLDEYTQVENSHGEKQDRMADAFAIGPGFGKVLEAMEKEKAEKKKQKEREKEKGYVPCRNAIERAMSVCGGGRGDCREAANNIMNTCKFVRN